MFCFFWMRTAKETSKGPRLSNSVIIDSAVKWLVTEPDLTLYSFQASPVGHLLVHGGTLPSPD
jgi:hypothetical protein